MKRFRLFYVILLVVSFCSCKKNSTDTEPVNPYNGKTKLVFNPSITYGTMKDQEGNVYKTVQIGNQTWMAENLRARKYNDSTKIEAVTGAYDYTTATTPVYFSYNNMTNIDSIATYGLLYNWYAVNTGKLAPKGWRIPTQSDWIQLVDYLGGIHEAADKLRQAGSLNWGHINADATNSSGFTAIGGGYRERQTSIGIGYYGYYWSSTSNINNSKTAHRIGFVTPYLKYIEYLASEKGILFSVRCIKE